MQKKICLLKVQRLKMGKTPRQKAYHLSDGENLIQNSVDNKSDSKKFFGSNRIPKSLTAESLKVEIPGTTP